MATRSRIAIENQDGTVSSIYCHFDGYPENNGVILFENYKTQEKVESLISLGSLSSLHEEIEIPEGVIHDFNNQVKGITVAYHRDRDEDLSIAEHSSVEDFIRGDIEIYGYIFTAAGEWLFVEGNTFASRREPQSLKSVLENKGILK
jgi:hypothetical protein